MVQVPLEFMTPELRKPWLYWKATKAKCLKYPSILKAIEYLLLALTRLHGYGMLKTVPLYFAYCVISVKLANSHIMCAKKAFLYYFRYIIQLLLL